MVATVSGERLALLFDTGGGQALVTPPVAERIGCRADGVSAGSRMSGERVTFGQCGRAEFGLCDATYVLPSLAVFDLNALLPAGLPRLDGLLALEAPKGPPFTLELDSGNVANVLLATHVRVDSAPARPQAAMCDAAASLPPCLTVRASQARAVPPQGPRNCTTCDQRTTVQTGVARRSGWET